MRKILFAIGMMAVVGIASAAESPAKGECQSPPEPMGACVFSPCVGKTFCSPIFGDSKAADGFLYGLELPCILKEQGPPPRADKGNQGPPPPSGGKH